MGFYIAGIGTGAPSKGKAAWIVNEYKQVERVLPSGDIVLDTVEFARVIESTDRALVIVIHNPAFEAAMLVYDKHELARFFRSLKDNNRPFEVLTMPKTAAWMAAGLKPGENPRASAM